MNIIFVAKGIDFMTIYSKWDTRFIELARMIASWSKDPSTKVGAVIVDDQRRIIAHGYNGFPRGVEDTDHRYSQKHLKYEMVVHAEVNAVLNANSPTKGCTLYSTFFPCPRCAAVIIQAEIKEVISTHNEADHRYTDQRLISQQMFIEAGVKFSPLLP